MTEQTPKVGRRPLLVAGAGIGSVVLLGSSNVAAAAQEGRHGGLDALTGDYPRAWFFRQTESVEDYKSYADWEARYRHLNGIHGKTFVEEIEFRDDLTREYFTRFKREHPDQIVLLHFNGKGRRPAFNPTAFSAGHWLYYAGTRTTAPSAAGERTLQVADATLFKMERHPDMFKDMPDDIVIVPPDENEHDWASAEHARLVDVDHAANTITVRRGQFGSTPIDVPEGAYVAPHVRQRPPALLPPDSLWVYNFSSIGPRDAEGRRCIDVLADELAGHFAPDGVLAAFDGLEFDVLFFLPDGRPMNGGRFVVDQELIDVDNDGVPDDVVDVAPGFVDGTNVYGLGATEFCRLLRERMPDKLIMADGMLPEAMQRSFRTLNGMEAEGFPLHGNPDFSDWSGGLNRFEFWRRRAARPRLNYLVYKYHDVQNAPAYHRLRLSLAAAQFTDSCFALGGRWAPPPVPWHGVEVQVFDELWLGQEQRRNWLGQPVGDPVHLAASTPNLLPDKEISGGEPDGRSPDTGARLVDWTLGDVELAGTDLYVELSVSGEWLARYPHEIARRLALRVFPQGSGEPAGEVLGWFDDRASTSTFAFRDLGPGTFRLVLRVEGRKPISVDRLSAHGHPDVMYREFEHGVVLANPSAHAYTFDLAGLLPGRSYRRILGVDSQDPRTNNGQPVGGEVTVGPIDGLFLVRTG